MGGGAASSMAAGANAAELDFDSVQRGNPEIERRAQEVINHCWSLGADNPVLAIHDVGAGGLSNAFPELVDGAGLGARFDLSAVPLEESGLAPKEAWCNESQERYVVALEPSSLPLFAALCDRERCPYAVVGVARDDGRLILADGPHDLDDEDRAIDMPMEVLLGKPPRMTRDVQRVSRDGGSIDLAGLDLRDAAYAVLRHPTVASKRFLVTIADRTVGGLTHRDQMVGPWQVPVADVAVTLADHVGFAGEAMATGERMPLAAVDAPASGRMAVGEALTNLLAAPVATLSGIKLSCNWMAACGEDGEDAALYDTVEAVAMRLLPELGVSVPVGKDSLSMRTRWADPVSGEPRQVTSPVSLVVTAFASLPDVRGTWTPQLRSDSALVLVDLGAGRDRLGGSILAQASGVFGGEVPDLDDPQRLLSLVAALAEIRSRGIDVAYHDRSDGGLWAAVCEMAFAGAVGVELDVPSVGALFAEELGVVLGVPAEEVRRSSRGARRPRPGRGQRDGGAHGIRPSGAGVGGGGAGARRAGARPGPGVGRGVVADRGAARQPRLRAGGARRGRGRRRPRARGGALVRPDRRRRGPLPQPRGAAEGGDPARAGGEQPRRDGLRVRPRRLRRLRRAHDRPADRAVRPRRRGRDWWRAAASPTATRSVRVRGGRARCCSTSGSPRASPAFFSRDDTFGLGICNGCQMFAALADLIPGAEAWPRFTRNRSEQYEARLTLVEVLESPSVLTAGMAGSRIPIAVAHGEGFADFSARGDSGRVRAGGPVRRPPRRAGARPTPSTPTARPTGSRR